MTFQFICEHQRKNSIRILHLFPRVNAVIIQMIYVSGKRKSYMDLYKLIRAKQDKIFLLAARFGIIGINIF